MVADSLLEMTSSVSRCVSQPGAAWCCLVLTALDTAVEHLYRQHTRLLGKETWTIQYSALDFKCLLYDDYKGLKEDLEEQYRRLHRHQVLIETTVAIRNVPLMYFKPLIIASQNAR